MRIFFLIASCLVSISALAQNTEEFLKYKKLYPNDSYVTLKNEIVYNIEINNDKIEITKDIFEENLYLDESANFNRKRSLTYSTFIDLEDIEAATLNPSDNSYDEIRVTEFTEKNDLDESFYDDSKRVSFIYPNLRKGSKTNLKYRYKIKNPRFLSPFYFGDYFPTAQTSVTIVADEDIDLEFKEFQTDTIQINFEKEEKRRRNIYKWTLQNAPGYDIENDAPSFKTILPHIIPVIKSYKTKEGEVKILEGVQDLYQWYYSLVKDINQQPADPELVELVKELIKGKTSELEKVKAIYYWTQTNIKYIAFEYALGGFIPREANDVFNKKYGDCKDNSSILYEMLKIAGIKGHLTWIGTRKIPYTYQEVPTPVVDNHMILSYENGEDTYYLDATGRHIRIDYPSPFIQGKEALVSYGPNDFKIKNVPVVPSEKNLTIDSTFVKIDGKSLIGNSRTYLKGYPQNDLYYRLERLDNDNEVLSYYKARFSKGNNSFLISDYKTYNTYSYENDFYIDYNFNIGNYVQNIGSEIFINPHLNRDFTELKTKEDRKYGIEYEYKRQFTYTNTFEIPEGYEVEYLPEDVEYKNDLVSIHLTYKKTGNTVVTEQSAKLDTLLITLEEQKEINDIVEKVEKAYKEIIVLKKK